MTPAAPHAAGVDPPRHTYSGRGASSASWITTVANCHPSDVSCNTYTTPARSSSWSSVLRRTATPPAIRERERGDGVRIHGIASTGQTSPIPSLPRRATTSKWPGQAPGVRVMGLWKAGSLTQLLHLL
jgi:hypothetical protein